MNPSRKDNLRKQAWEMCCSFRGIMDGIEMRDYIFVMLFYKYISESFRYWFNKLERERGDKSYDYAKLSSEKARVWEKQAIDFRGFFILPEDLFESVYEKGAKEESFRENELIRKLTDVFKSIETSSARSDKSNNMKGLLISVKWDSEKLGKEVREANRTVWRIMQGIQSLELRFHEFNEEKSSETYEDNLGDLYEYLMGQYASSAGKKAGEFYTPASVSELLTHLICHDKKHISSVYDPTCGSGSLLLKSIKILGKKNVARLCGQEKHLTTYNLCRMNMFLHHVQPGRFDIKNGDTLEWFGHGEERFDAIVSNPPYSIKWRQGTNDEWKFRNDERFAEYSLPPKHRADWAFILHCVYCLSTKGKAAIVCPVGALNREGEEQKIRKKLIDKNYIETVILLPSDLFFRTAIATAIVVLSKSKNNNGILFIDASNQFLKNKGETILSQDNISWILEAYKKRETREYVSTFVSKEELEEANYDLGVATYVKAEPKSSTIDIQKLEEDLANSSNRIMELWREIDNLVKDLESLKQ